MMKIGDVVNMFPNRNNDCETCTACCGKEGVIIQDSGQGNNKRYSVEFDHNVCEFDEIELKVVE